MMVWRVSMLALAEGWASQSNSALSDVIAELARVIGRGDFKHPKASAFEKLETFKVGNVCQDHAGIARTLAQVARHLASGTAEGNKVARAALGAIWVSTDAVRAYCRDRQILVPRCIREASRDPRLALEDAAAVYVGLRCETLNNNPEAESSPAELQIHRGYKEADAPLVEAALALMKDDKALSPWAAVSKLEKLPGHGTDESRRKRIHRRLLKALESTPNNSKDSKAP